MSSLLSIYNERFNILPLRVAFPYFSILIALELFSHWRHWKKHLQHRQKLKDNEKYPQYIRPFYRINDSIASVICGICDLITGKLMSSIWVMITYAWVYHYFRLFDWNGASLSENWTKWLLLHFVAFMLKDYFYYWFHRAIHEVNIGWASHAPHHNSEEYNLTTALRQGMFQSFFGPFFYVPMAIVGIPPEVYSFHTTVNLLWQFWIHTRSIKKLHPYFEYIFNTPSHHRLHHGRNPEAIDKNYGGTLILFDRLHGTFEAEGRDVLYGTIHPIQSFNALTSQFHHFKAIFQTCMSKGIQPWEWIRIAFMPPGYDHSTGELYPIPDVDENKADRYDRTINWPDTIYSVMCFIRIVVIGMKFLAHHQSSFSEKAIQWATIFFSIVIVGYICDGFRSRTRMLESIRTLISVLAILIGGRFFEHLFAFSAEGKFRYFEGIFTLLSFVYANFIYKGDTNAIHEWELELENANNEIEGCVSSEEEKSDYIIESTKQRAEKNSQLSREKLTTRDGMISKIKHD